MTEIETKLVDLLDFSSSQKPVDFENTFKALMADRVQAAIADKKQQVAMSVFSSQADEVDTETGDDIDGEAA